MFLIITPSLIIAIKVIYQERNKSEYTDPDSINKASTKQNLLGYVGGKLANKKQWVGTFWPVTIREGASKQN